MRFGYLATEPLTNNLREYCFLVSPTILAWLTSQVYPNLFPGFLFFPFLRAEDREGNEVDLYQFAGQITLTISNMITISNLPLEDTKKELILLLERYPTNFVASHSKLWPFPRRPEWSEIKGFLSFFMFAHLNKCFPSSKFLWNIVSRGTY